MANPNVLVANVSSLSPAAETVAFGSGQATGQFKRVNFQGGSSGLLDLNHPRTPVWSGILESSQQTNSPVYVEIDPTNSVITQLLYPLTVGVGDITPNATGDVVEVELIISHALHYLIRSNPDFQALLDILQTAHDKGTMVIVTETPDTHEIIDVRALPNSLVPELLGPPPELDVTEALSLVTPAQAQMFYDLVSGKSCCPASGTAPCIPFLFPDDGCWGRAHEMCRLILAAGVEPAKVWIYGALTVKTSNNPSCAVHWGWHVAPTLLVKTGSTTEIQVIDPSLFAGPVSQATWASVQGDSSALLVASSAAVFYRSRNGSVSYDNASYTQTKAVLDTYRNQLKLRSVGSDGPPPYTQCMVKPKGVQWFGSIEPNATARWFTYGWSSSWNVIWTVMPLTPCSGAPQLSSQVAVERANATECTYWITVKNLTASPVKLEGRYDILP